MLWATTPGLLEHFGLDGVDNSPNLGEVRTEGLLDFVTAAAVDNADDENPGDRRKCCNLRGTAPVLLQRLPVHIENIVYLLALPNAPMFFTFPDDARWNAERQAVEFCVEIGNTTASCGYPGACFSACCRRRPPPNAALKHTICSGHALRGSPSGSCGGVS